MTRGGLISAGRGIIIISKSPGVKSLVSTWPPGFLFLGPSGPVARSNKNPAANRFEGGINSSDPRTPVRATVPGRGPASPRPGATGIASGRIGMRHTWAGMIGAPVSPRFGETGMRPGEAGMVLGETGMGRSLTRIRGSGQRIGGFLTRMARSLTRTRAFLTRTRRSPKRIRPSLTRMTASLTRPRTIPDRTARIRDNLSRGRTGKQLEMAGRGRIPVDPIARDEF